MPHLGLIVSGGTRRSYAGDGLVDLVELGGRATTPPAKRSTRARAARLRIPAASSSIGSPRTAIPGCRVSEGDQRDGLDFGSRASRPRCSTTSGHGVPDGQGSPIVRGTGRDRRRARAQTRSIARPRSDSYRHRALWRRRREQGPARPRRSSRSVRGASGLILPGASLHRQRRDDRERRALRRAARGRCLCRARRLPDGGACTLSRSRRRLAGSSQRRTGCHLCDQARAVLERIGYRSKNAASRPILDCIGECLSGSPSWSSTAYEPLRLPRRRGRPPRSPR